MNRLIQAGELQNLKNALEGQFFDCSFDPASHRMLFQNPETELSFQIRLPLNFDYGQSEANEAFTYIIALVKSESAAVGIFADCIMEDHKVFKSYTVRKKQGKSQLKYLKTKGKSKAGSRVRLANAMAFLEDVNERLTEYFDEYEVDKIAMSCSKILLPHLYESSVPCPFVKKDERIFNIPRHIHSPTFELLKSTNDYLLHAELFYNDKDEEAIEALVASIL